MTFLECVTRILRSMAVIRGDTDAPTAFSDTQLNAELQLAQIAVQNELTKLIADRMIPKERNTSGSITLVAGTATYDLASGFISFFGKPHLRHSDGYDIFEYKGGLEQLQIDDFNYASAQGAPNWYYFAPQSSSLKKIGFYTVPSAAGTVTYDYEGSVMVSAVSDNLPFHTDEENYAFTDMAGRRYKFMWEDTKAEADIALVLEKDFSYKTARATLNKLLRGQNVPNTYGFRYC